MARKTNTSKDFERKCHKTRDEKMKAKADIKKAKLALANARAKAGKSELSKKVTIVVTCLALVLLGALGGWYATAQSFKSASGTTSEQLEQAQEKNSKLQSQLDEANAKIQSLESSTPKDLSDNENEQSEQNSKDTQDTDRTNTSDEESSSSETDEKSLESYIGTWVGTLSSSIGGSFGTCYGAQGNPMIVTVESISGSQISASIKVLYHAHATDTLTSDEDSDAADSYLSESDLVATYGDNVVFTLTTDVKGNYAIVRVHFGSNPSADVESYYGGSSDPASIDTYTLKRS